MADEDKNTWFPPVPTREAGAAGWDPPVRKKPKETRQILYNLR